MQIKETYPELDSLQTNIFTVVGNLKRHDLHHHKLGGITVPQNGVIYLMVEERLHIVPPHQAIYIPPYVQHQVYKPNNKIIVETVFFQNKYQKQLPKVATTISLSELAKALIARVCNINDDELESKITKHMLCLLLHELREEHYEPSRIVKIPQKVALRKVFDFLTHSLDVLPNLEDCARLINVSPRTLQRMLYEELNITFILWRQQIIFARAIELLGKYNKVSEVAYRLGFNSEGGFISMFKKMSGGISPAAMSRQTQHTSK